MAVKRLTRNEKKARTRSQLLAGAERVFARRGIGASLEDVADEAGFSKGAVYSNFASKDDLVLALVERHMDERLAELRRVLASGLPLPEQVAEASRSFVSLLKAERDQHLLFVELCAAAARTPGLGQRFAERYRALIAELAALIDAQAEALGLPRRASPERVAAAVLAMAHGFALQKLIDPGAVDDAALEDMVLGYLASLGAV